MGTRAQVHIKDTGVYLYQHWDGDGLADKVKTAMKSEAGQDRLNDPDYLGRIIFCQMVKDNMKESTGYGIGTHQTSDIEYLITVNCKQKQVVVENLHVSTPEHFTFDEFINGKVSALDKIVNELIKTGCSPDKMKEILSPYIKLDVK